MSAAILGRLLTDYACIWFWLLYYYYNIIKEHCNASTDVKLFKK